MKLINRFFTAMMILSFGLLSACNLPSRGVKQPGANQGQQAAAPQAQDLSNALTLAVQTIQAATLTAQAGAPAPTATSAGPATPTVSVNSATNCRTGPGTAYDLVLTFQPGATAEVIGKYSPSNYWIIKTPTGGTCWLWGAYATVQGNTAALAEMVPPPAPVVAEAPTDIPSSGSNSGSGSNPPTPTATSAFYINPGIIQNVGPLYNPGIIQALAKPSAPPSLSVSTTCTYKSLFPVPVLKSRMDHLSWPSVSLATGYTVYVNGNKLTNTTGTSVNSTPSSIGNVTFGVAAYNSIGSSSTTTHTSKCP